MSSKCFFQHKALLLTVVTVVRRFKSVVSCDAKILTRAIENYRLESYVETLKRNNMLNEAKDDDSRKESLLGDGLEVFEAVDKMVRRFCDIYYGDIETLRQDEEAFDFFFQLVKSL